MQKKRNLIKAGLKILFVAPQATHDNKGWSVGRKTILFCKTILSVDFYI